MNVIMLSLLCVLQPPPDGVESFVLRSGVVLKARVLQVEDASVLLRVELAGGSYQARRSLASFTPPTAYRILSSWAGDAPEDHLELARFARDSGLIAVAERELQRARELARDPNLASDLGHEIDARGAASLEALFRSELRPGGDLTKARQHLVRLVVRYPGEVTAAHREELAMALDSRLESRRTVRRLAATSALRDAVGRRREKFLAPLRRRMTRAVEYNRRGLLNSDHFASARVSLTRAVREYELAIRSGESLLREHSRDPMTAKVVTELLGEARTALQDSLLNAASMALVRGQFGAAIQEVNRVLVIDPRNDAARAMRARIEIAANQWGYGYGHGGMGRG